MVPPKYDMKSESNPPEIHRQDELEQDTDYTEWLPDSVMHRWFEARYSSSKHLLTLYSAARGIKAETILEMGFGRSTFIFARAAHENGGKVITCDTADYSHLLNETEKTVVDYRCQTAEAFFKDCQEGFGLIFLDYLGGGASEKFCRAELLRALPYLKQNGLLLVHDAFCSRFAFPDVLKKLFNGWRGMQRRREFELSVFPYN